MPDSNKLYEQILGLRPSPIRVIFEAVAAMEARGENITRLDIGSPGFKPPSTLMREVHSELNAGNTGYISNWGSLELRQTISKQIAKDSGKQFNPAQEIIITNGASQAVAAVIFSLFNDEDSFLIPTPAWPHYIACCEMYGKKYKEITTSLQTQFKLTPELIISNIDSTTRALVLNSPCNPTGSSYTKREFRDILDVCRSKNITLVFDEIYQFLNDSSNASLLSECRQDDDIVYVNGFSKSLAITGMRIGYIAADKELTSHFIKFLQFNTVCGQGFTQKACASFLNNEEEFHEYLHHSQSDLRRCRTLMLDFKAKGVDMTDPEGAFYSFIRIPSNFDNATEFCKTILENEKISLIPGSGFGSAYEKYYRLSYGSVSSDKLEVALNHLSRYY